VLVILDVSTELTHDGSVFALHLVVRLRVVRRGGPVRDPEE